MVVLQSCLQFDPNKESENTGQLKIGIDESYSVLMQSQVETYLAFHPHAEIIATYKPETDVINDLMRDTVLAAVVCRDLTADEKAVFESRQRIVTSIKIATDGLALVTHPENDSLELTIEQLKDIFSGRTTTWNQLSSSASADPINIVFDNPGSCNARYIKDEFLNGAEFPANCFAVHSNDEVMKYVADHKNAMGVVSVAWISDTDDPQAQEFLSNVRVVALSDSAGVYRKPYQAYIYDHSYPLRRDVYYIKTGLKETLGTGFASHLAGPKGQTIIHKSGMVSATPPTRVVRLTEE